MLIHWSVSAWTGPLLLVLAAGAVVSVTVLYRRTTPDPGPGSLKVLIWLRSMALVCLIGAVGAPFLAMNRTRVDPAELLVLVEDSASMAISDAGVGNFQVIISRWRRAMEICRTLASLREPGKGPVQPVFMRGNGLSAPVEFRLGDAVIPPPQAERTDLDGLLQRSLGLRRGRPVAAVVLISDGCESFDQDLPDGLGDVAGLPTRPSGRFFAVGVGDPVGPRDRFLSDVRYPGIVHRGDKVQVDCVVQQRFVDPAAGDSMIVTLSGADGLLTTVQVPATADAVPVSLVFTADQDGMQVYSLAVSPLDNERFPANNQVSLGISVLKDRARLLLLTTDPRWDARFLAQAAFSEPRLVMEVAYPGAKGLVLADSLSSWRIPRTAAQWSRFDGVILEFSTLPDSLWTAGGKGLLEAVQAGKGLLVLPGPGFGKSLSGLVPPLPGDLAAILPVQASDGRWQTGDFFLTPASGSTGNPVMEGVLAAETGPAAGGPPQAGLLSVPPQEGLIPVLARSEAQVLLLGKTPRNRVWPALVLGASGQGRVAWFGGSALWEIAFWEQGQDTDSSGTGHPGRRLLRNLLVWLGTGEEAGGLRFQGEMPLARAGQPLTLAGIWQDMRGKPVAAGRVVLQVKPLGEDEGIVAGKSGVRTYDAGALDPQTGEFPVPVPPLSPGRYALKLLGQGAGSTESQPATLVVEASSVEVTQVRQDSRRLIQLAARENGRYVAAADSSSMAALMVDLANQEWPGRSQQLRSRLDLAAGLPFLGLVIVLLGCEWYLRRRHGLL